MDNAGPAPAEVFVFPGTYAESVDLSDMGSAIAGAPGDITLTTVDAAGAPTPGTATVQPAADNAFKATAGAFPGDIIIDGFNVTSPDEHGIDLTTDGDNITIQNVTAEGSGDGLGDDDGVNVASNTGNIAVANSVATGNDDDGYQLVTSAAITVTDSTASDNGDQGIDIFGGSSSVSVENSTANGNDDHGIFVEDAITATISGSAANGNGLDGISIDLTPTIAISGSDAHDNGEDGVDVDDATTVTITGTHASGNSTALFGDDNFDIDASDSITISDSSALDNLDDDGFDVDGGAAVTITNSTANGNADEGFEIDASNVTMDGVTANNNGGDGADIECYEPDGCAALVQSVSVANSLFVMNDDSGVDLDGVDEHDPTGTFLVNGNIICQNTGSGLEQNSDITTDATGNWWGSATGPAHPNNAGGTGDAVIDADNPAGEEPGLGTVDFDPWIDTVSGSGAAASIGVPVVVTFEFTDTSVALTEGPGDPNGDPTFAASTDNGTVNTSGFVSGGTLEVTLTPSAAGTATVDITGPCGLTGPVTVDVAAAAASPTATPAELPETGGSSAGSSNLPWLALVAVLGAATVSGGVLVAVTKR